MKGYLTGIDLRNLTDALMGKYSGLNGSFLPRAGSRNKNGKIDFSCSVLRHPPPGRLSNEVIVLTSAYEEGELKIMQVKDFTPPHVSAFLTKTASA